MDHLTATEAREVELPSRLRPFKRRETIKEYMLSMEKPGVRLPGQFLTRSGLVNYASAREVADQLIERGLHDNQTTIGVSGGILTIDKGVIENGENI